MQKPIEGLPVMALFPTNSMLKKVEGIEAEETIGAYQRKQSLYKRGYSHRRAHQSPIRMDKS